jgi:hypothetical protein
MTNCVIQIRMVPIDGSNVMNPKLGERLEKLGWLYWSALGQPTVNKPQTERHSYMVMQGREVFGDLKDCIWGRLNFKT